MIIWPANYGYPGARQSTKRRQRQGVVEPLAKAAPRISIAAAFSVKK